MNAGAVAFPVTADTRRLADQSYSRGHVSRIVGGHRRRVAEVVVDRRRTPVLARFMHTPINTVLKRNALLIGS